MKNFSLLSLLAIAALSVSISHAAAEADLFQERVFFKQGELFGYKEVGPDNWTYCQVKDQHGDLTDPSNWSRFNNNFYRKVETAGQAKFVIRLEGPRVAGIADRFGGSVAKPQSAVSAPKMAGNDEQGEDEAKARFERQDDILFPEQDGKAESGDAKGWRHRIKHGLEHFVSAARQATAVLPEHEAVYRFDDETQMRWNGQTKCYELFEMTEVADENEGSFTAVWNKADDVRYALVGFAENGNAEFKAIEEKEEAAQDEEKGQADSARQQDKPVTRAIAINDVRDAQAELEAGNAENAFDHTIKAGPRGNVFSRAWGHVVSAVNESTAVVDQAGPSRRTTRRKSVDNSTANLVVAQEAPAQDGQPAEAASSQSPKRSGKQGWGARFGDWAADFKGAVGQATAVVPNDGGEQDPERLMHEGEADAEAKKDIEEL